MANENERRRDDAERRVRHFLKSGGQWLERGVPTPVPPPKAEWTVTTNDRKFLRSLRIDPDGTGGAIVDEDAGSNEAAST